MKEITVDGEEVTKEQFIDLIECDTPCKITFKYQSWRESIPDNYQTIILTQEEIIDMVYNQLSLRQGPIEYYKDNKHD